MQTAVGSRVVPSTAWYLDRWYLHLYFSRVYWYWWYLFVDEYSMHQVRQLAFFAQTLFHIRWRDCTRGLQHAAYRHVSVVTVMYDSIRPTTLYLYILSVSIHVDDDDDGACAVWCGSRTRLHADVHLVVSTLSRLFERSSG